MTQWGEKSGVALASWNVPFYHVKLKINISSTKVNVVTPIKNVKKIKKKKTRNKFRIKFKFEGHYSRDQHQNKKELLLFTLHPFVLFGIIIMRTCYILTFKNSIKIKKQLKIHSKFNILPFKHNFKKIQNVKRIHVCFKDVLEDASFWLLYKICLIYLS